MPENTVLTTDNHLKMVGPMRKKAAPAKAPAKKKAAGKKAAARKTTARKPAAKKATRRAKK